MIDVGTIEEAEAAKATILPMHSRHYLKVGDTDRTNQQITAGNEHSVGGEVDDRLSIPYGYNAESNQVGHPVDLL